MSRVNHCTIWDEAYLRHLTGRGHPESPKRAEVIYRALVREGLIDQNNQVRPRLAMKEEILLCHSLDYFTCVEENVSKARLMGLDDGSFTLSTGDVQICPDSLEIALLAAGGVLTAVDIILSGKSLTAFCIVRPPGHHACRERGMGFCIFNNVAIGARYAQAKFGIKKLLIVDWDVHHGNGTEEIFYDDPTVFYFSTHQEGIYPGTGASDCIGIGKGVGTTLNCPIQPGETSRDCIIKAFTEKLTNAMVSFKPELIFISAGFDAHEADPLGRFNLRENDFAELTFIVKNLAFQYSQGRIISVLEGGYNLRALALSVVSHVRALQGKDKIEG